MNTRRDPRNNLLHSPKHAEWETEAQRWSAIHPRWHKLVKAWARVLPRAEISHPYRSESQLDCQVWFHFLLWSQIVILNENTLRVLAKAHWMASLRPRASTRQGLTGWPQGPAVAAGDRGCWPEQRGAGDKEFQRRKLLLGTELLLRICMPVMKSPAHEGSYSWESSPRKAPSKEGRYTFIHSFTHSLTHCWVPETVVRTAKSKEGAGQEEMGGDLF